MDTLISPQPQTALGEPAQVQSIDPQSYSFADVATVKDTPGSAVAQASPENNVLPPYTFLKSTQPRESPSKDPSDSSPSGQRDLKEENEPSEGKDEAHATFGEKVKEISNQVVKCGHYLHEMAEQVGEWEEKIRKLVSTDNGDWKMSERKDFAEVPITPTIRLVNWTDFKNRHSVQTQVHAIEVLVGDAKTCPQQYEDEKQNVDEGGNDHFSQENLIGKTFPLPSAAASHGDMPNQIRINSKMLLQMLSDVSAGDWELEPTLMSRPYGFLAYYEPGFQEVLDRLEAKWADTERDPRVQISPSHNSSLVAAEKEQPIAPVGAGHSEKHAKVYGISEKNEIILESSENAIPIKQVESEKVPHGEKLKQRTGAQTSSTEIMDSVEALREVRCLMQFIKIYLKPHWNVLDSARHHKIRFVDLWHIFKPGDQVFAPLRAGNDAEALSPQENQQNTDSKSSLLSKERYQKVWRVYYTHSGAPYHSPEELESRKGHSKPKPGPFWLRCYYLDFDGERVGPVMHNFKINAFQGEKDINSLPIYPMKYAKNAAKVEDQMRKRGQMFREFDTFQHRDYIGASLVHQPSGDPILNEDDQPMNPENIASQVIVDFSGVLQRNSQWYPDFHIGKFPTRDYQVDLSPIMVWKDNERKILDHEVDELIWHPDYLDMKLARELRERESILKDDYDESPTALADLCDDDLILLPARVFAYSFRNRKFALLKINDLRPVTPRDEGFKSLILPSGHKRTVQALVRSHFSQKLSNRSLSKEDDESDLVRGKGKGLIVLLHGAPGVGKTSTAECVAEANGKPLLPITCGDLGLVAEVVEENLSKMFYLAERWDCVLLLDEADVFLAERTKSDLKRNSLVSVFLRILEYYTGILFLTTNRVGAIDPAFKSRIHMHLYYPPLSEKQTLAIWKVNLDRMKRSKENVNVDVDEIKEFALHHFRESSSQNAAWNGRQIRNAFQTATALAEYDAWESTKQKSVDRDPSDHPKLNKKYFEIVAKTSLDFDLYMKETMAVSEADRALQGAERADEFVSRMHYDNQGQFETSQPRLLQHEQFQYHSGPREALYRQSWQPGLTTPMRQAYQSQPQQSMQPVTLTTKEEQYSQRQQIAADGGYSSFQTAGFSSTPPATSPPRNDTMLTHDRPLKANARDNWHGPSQFSGRRSAMLDEDDEYE